MIKSIKLITHRRDFKRFYVKQEGQPNNKVTDSSGKNTTMKNGGATPVKMAKTDKRNVKSVEKNKVLLALIDMMPQKQYDAILQQVLRKLIERKAFIITLGYNVKKGKTIYLSININEKGNIEDNSIQTIATASEIKDMFTKLTFN